MGDRPFGQTTVNVAKTGRWMREVVPKVGDIVWKSDTQGFDQVIIAQTVLLAKIELRRIRKPIFDAINSAQGSTSFRRNR